MKALKTRCSKVALISYGKRLGPLDQVHEVPVAVGEKYQPVALVHVWLAHEINALRLERGVRGVEILHFDGQMADAWIAHFLLGARAFRRNDFEHRAVGRADEIIAVVFEINAEAQMIHVPLRQLRGTRRSDGGVLQADKHIFQVYPAGALL